MANRINSGKGSLPRSESKVLGEKRISVELDEEIIEEVGFRKRIKMRDLESVCRAEGGNKKPSGQFQFDDEEMSEVTEVPITSDLDASRGGKAVRSTFPVVVNAISKPPDLNTDACVSSDKAQNKSQQCSRSPGKTTALRDEISVVPVASNMNASQAGKLVRNTIPVVVNPPFKQLDLNTDECIANSTFQNDSQQCSQSLKKTSLPRGQVTEVPKTSDLDVSGAGKCVSSTISAVVNPIVKLLDLNTDVCIANNTVKHSSPQCSQNVEKIMVPRDHGKDCQTSRVSAIGKALDVNSAGVSSSETQDPFYPFRNLNYLKSRDASECGSCTGTLEEKDPMTVWKEMKQNGFLSPTHGIISKPKQPVAIPTPKQQHGSMPAPKQQNGGMPLPKQLGCMPMPKQHGGMPIPKQHGSIPMSKQHGGIPMPKPRLKKYKTEEQKKKVERAKKEQVDRFAKIAAPSGLLNELNPGIINHVRNRKQVHSIIEALVRSERHEISPGENHQTIYQQSGIAETSQYLETTNESWHPSTFFENLQTQGYTILMNKPSMLQVDNSFTVDPTAKHSFGGINFASHSNVVSEDETLALKVSSSNIAAEEDTPLLSKEEITSYLSFKAATVASQWLELIQQDIQGRLSALQRSRKRVRNVISTDLPLLLTKEFSSDKENASSITNSSVEGLPHRTCADLHRARWGPRFDQMDKSLSEEEDQLKSWLNQVKEMQAHCNKGLQLINLHSGIEASGTSDSRSHLLDSSEREVALRAAAASIYATCNFILSANASPCC